MLDSRSGKCFLVLLLTSFAFLNAIAQQDSLAVRKSIAKKQAFSIGLGLQHGFIFAHSEEVENTKGARPTGVEAIFSWQRTDSAIWSLCNCYPRKGILLAYYDYDNKILGKSATAAYFLEPTYKIGNRTFFSFKGAVGASYLTHPFDSLKNPANQSYSTTLNAYLLVGVGAWFRIHNNWWLNPSINYQHISNGGMREPNKGINWPTAGLAVSYQRAAPFYFTGHRLQSKFWKEQPLRFDVALFGTARREVDLNGKSRRMPLVGVAVQAAKQVGRNNNLTIGIEASRDEELQVELERNAIEASPVTAAFIAGHEFILGRFLFSQRLGVYVFDQSPYFDALYHRWGLSYRMHPNWGIGFTLKAHRQVADYADVRLHYFLQRRHKQ